MRREPEGDGKWEVGEHRSWKRRARTRTKRTRCSFCFLSKGPPEPPCIPPALLTADTYTAANFKRLARAFRWIHALSFLGLLCLVRGFVETGSALFMGADLINKQPRRLKEMKKELRRHASPRQCRNVLYGDPEKGSTAHRPCNAKRPPWGRAVYTNTHATLFP